MKLRAKYGHWQQALERSFFSSPGEPVLFFVDDEELIRLFEGPGDPVESLRSAISEYVVLSSDDPTGPIGRILMQWRMTDRNSAPPVLPLLAMCVLAATRMDNSPGQKSTNFYSPLAELLAGEPNEELAGVIRIKASEELSRFWKNLHVWIESQRGRVGISTIQSVGSNHHIGYPLSQSILKQHDKRLLYKFFDDIGATSTFRVETKRLMDSLEKWGPERQGFSKRFQLSLKSQTDRKVLEKLVYDLASMNPKKRDELSSQAQSVATGKIRIAIGRELEECFLIFDLNQTVNVSNFLLGERKLHLEGSGEPNVKFGYFLEPINFSRLSQGLFITNGESSFRRAPFKALILEKNASAEAWVETHRIVSDRSYIVVAEKEEATRLMKSFSGALNFQNSESLRGTLGSMVIARNVKFVDSSLASDFARLVGLRLEQSEKTSPKVALRGGLKLSSTKLRSLYFVGGEPDLCFDDPIPSKVCPVLVDGEVEELKVRRGNILSLRDLELPQGTHAIQTVSGEVQFRTSLDPLEVTAVSSLGEDSLKAVLEEESGWNTNKVSPMLLKRNCAKSIFLIHGGHTQMIKEPGKVQLIWDSRFTLHTTMFEVECVPDNASFVAQLKGSHWWVRDLSISKHEIYQVDGSIDLAHQWYLAYRKERMEVWRLLLKFGAPIDE